MPLLGACHVVGRRIMEEKSEVFNKGDKVISQDGDWKGTVVRIGPYGKTGHVKWENNQQEIVNFADIKKPKTLYYV